MLYIFVIIWNTLKTVYVFVGTGHKSYSKFMYLLVRAINPTTSLCICWYGPYILQQVYIFVGTGHISYSKFIYLLVRAYNKATY